MLLHGQSILSELDGMHTVAKGETWESIAASHGISIDELRAANPDVRKKKPKKGTLLIIPKPPVPEPIPVPEEPQPLIRTSMTDLKVGVLLPFSDKKMLEFYRGFLMAADSVRRGGTNIDIYAWDCGTTSSKIEPLLSELNGLDIVFGPSSPTQIPLVAEACKTEGIRLVLPFWSGQALLDYPMTYNASAPNSIVYAAAVKKLMSYYPDRNFVIAHSGKAEEEGNNPGKTLVETLSRTLSERQGNSRKLEIEGDDFAYEAAFNQFRDNMIVLDDSSVPSLNILLSRLKDFLRKHPQYRVSLIGYTEWLEETEHLLDNLFACDTYIITPYYYNVLDSRTDLFERAYSSNFRTTVSRTSPRYAALGYDLGCFFLSGLACLGDTFEQMNVSLRQEPYQNWFNFERDPSGLGFTNHFVQFVHFTKENKIELIR